MYRYVHDTGSAYRYRVEFDWCMLTSRARTLALHAGRVLVRWGGLAQWTDRRLWAIKAWQ